MNIAIIFAGGVGKRMNMSGAPKQFLNLNNKPILIHALEHFEYSNEIDKIVIVMLEDYISLTENLVRKYGITKVDQIVPGGATGQESIFNGLKAASAYENNGDNIVLIHDGVRPFFEDDLISRSIASVREFGSAISCVPSNETTVLVEDGNIENTTNRSKTFIARAPQSFYLNDIISWHQKALENNDTSLTDSCSMMMKYGDKKPHMVETCFENVKITTPADFYIAKALLEAKNNMEALGVDLESYK